MSKLKKITLCSLLFFILISTCTLLTTKISANNDTPLSGFVFDKRCQHGYGLPYKIVTSENDKIKTYDEKIKSLSAQNEIVLQRINELLKLKKLSKKEQIDLSTYQTIQGTYNYQINEQMALKNQAIDPNIKNSCTLIDSSKVDYNLNQDEYINSTSYLLVNDDSGIIVASKNASQQINARDFTKLFFLGLINKRVQEGNLDLNYKLKVPNNILEITSENNLNSVGLKPNKEYNVKDLINLLKYKNFDDVTYALAYNLFGSEKNASDKINEFLKNDVKLEQTNINNIYGLSPGDISNKISNNTTSANDIYKFKKFVLNNNYYLVSNVSYETSLTSLSKLKKLNKETTMMDPNSDWYYSDVKEYIMSSYKDSQVSGLYDINKLNQKYTLVLLNTASRENLYAGATKLMKNAVNYKYSNILLSRKDEAKINKLLSDNGIELQMDVLHKANKSDFIIPTLATSLSANMPEDYLQYMKISVKMKHQKIAAPIKKKEIIGEIIFDDSKYQKIKTFSNQHVFKLDLYANKEVKRKNIIVELIDNVQNFFDRWMNATNRINN